MTYPQGISFRATSGYVTDVSPSTYEIYDTNTGPPNYPVTTPQGNTVGYETGTSAPSNPRNRSSTNDARLAGAHSSTSATQRYRFDLPSTGSYNIRVAAGDAVYSSNTNIELFDTTTSLGVLCSGSTGAGNSFKDASNTIRTALLWPLNNTAATVTFTTTIARFKLSTGTSAGIAHLYIESAGGTQTYSYSATGGFVLSGTSARVKTAIKTPTGGLTLLGTANPARGATRTTIGGLIFGGTATPLRSLVRAATGGVLFSGAASVSFFSAVPSLTVIASGGILIRGTAAMVRGVVKAVTGGVVFGGSSSVTLTPDPSPTTKHNFKRGRRPRTRPNY